MGKKVEQPTKLQIILEKNPDADILVADGFDDAVIGICDDFNAPPRLVYSVSKCIEILADGMKVSKDDLEDGETIEEKKYQLAKEYFEYNTIGAYAGAGTPVWCQDDF